MRNFNLLRWIVIRKKRVITKITNQIIKSKKNIKGSKTASVQIVLVELGRQCPHQVAQYIQQCKVTRTRTGLGTARTRPTAGGKKREKKR